MKANSTPISSSVGASTTMAMKAKIGNFKFELKANPVTATMETQIVYTMAAHNTYKSQKDCDRIIVHTSKSLRSKNSEFALLMLVIDCSDNLEETYNTQMLI